MAIQVGFRTLIEDQPGADWQAAFERAWPGYRAWFLRGGAVGRPSFLESRRALREHMPELVPTWEKLVDLATPAGGGGDVEARFLSLWCPPPYIAGCSQGVWLDAGGHEPPALIRNYDFAPLLLEGNWLATRWTGQRVVALGDCAWGVLDGINESGLAAALSFGGRTTTGTGFGIPLVLRYVLELACDTAEAIAILRRVPVHMTYSVTLLDAKGEWATVFVAPDRPVEVTKRQAVTNFQQQVEWPEHARATRSAERLSCLQARLAANTSLADAVGSLLQPPMFQDSYLRGYGTLYTAVYRCAERKVELHWPGVEPWRQSVAAFEAGQREITYASGSE